MTKQQIPLPYCDHPKSHPAPQSFTSHKELHYHPAPSATSTITLRTRHRNHHAQQFIFYVSTSFTLIHLKALLPATKQQIPLPSYNHPKAILSHEISLPTKSFTTTPSPRPQPLPFTHHRNHHAQQLIFCVSSSFILIHLKALLLATRQKIPLPPATTQKAILPHRISLPAKSFTTTFPATSAIAIHPPSKPPCTTTYFLRFDFIHPDTPKSIAPRDQATNPSTLLRPPKKPPCPTKFHFPQRASLPPRPPATSAIAIHPPSKPPCTTTYFLRFDFIHPDTPKSIAPRDQATNPSTLLRPPKKPPCPTKFHFPQRASLPPRPPATSAIALRTRHRNHHAQQFIFRVSTSFTLTHLKALLPTTKQ